MRPWLWGLGFVLLVSLALFGLRSCPPQNPANSVTPDTIPDEQVVRERPKPPTSIPQRIAKGSVTPQVVVSRGTPDTLLVRRFAAMVRLADSLRRSNDSLRQIGGRPVPLPSVLPAVWGEYRSDNFRVWFSRSDGSVLRATAKLKPNWSFRSGMDSVSEKMPQFYQDRAWLRTLRQVKKCAPATGVMAGVGALVGQDRLLTAAVTGGATLVGCLVG